MSHKEPPQLTPEEVKKKIDKLLRHQKNVLEAGIVLGKKLIDKAKTQNEINFGVHVIAQCQPHDNSKWYGSEWDYLIMGDFNGEAKAAANHHARTNQHHPEYWSDVDQMPKLFVAEMCCDFYARATEFGTDVMDFVKNKAMPRYNIKPQSKVYKWIKEFFDLLLEKPFTQEPQE